MSRTERRIRCGDGKAEGGAGSRDTFHGDGAVVVFGDGLYDGETEAGVAAGGAAGGIDTIEAVEQARQVLGGDAGTGVFHFEHGLTFGRENPNAKLFSH